MAKMPREVCAANGRLNGPANGRLSMAKMPREVLQANGRSFDPALRRAIGRLMGSANGLANSLAAAEHKRTYRGVLYRSNWEVVVAVSLTKAGLEFEYEQHTFPLGKHSSYTPDFYVPSLKLYVEVKGRERDNAMRKYAAFAKNHKTLLLTQPQMLLLYAGVRTAKHDSIQKLVARVVPFSPGLFKAVA